MFKDKELWKIIDQLSEYQNQKQADPIVTYSTRQSLMRLTDLLNQNNSKHKEIEKEYESTKEASRKMLSNISHDLRTPLTVIKGVVELIDLETKSREENEKHIKTIDTKIDEVTRLIQEFFELNKLESQDLSLKYEKIDVVELSRKILLGHADSINRHGLEVDFDTSDSRIIIKTDKSLLERILNNLLKNAIDYGHVGKIVGIRIKNYDDSVSIGIWDKGKGIDDINHERVFERLFTLEDSRSKDYSGSGLGLSITKRLVESLGGYITLESVPFHYTEFKVTFPKI